MKTRNYINNLTKREVEILRLCAKGFTNNQIAEELFISSHTVKNHFANIMEKLNAPTRTSAVAKAVWMGLF